MTSLYSLISQSIALESRLTMVEKSINDRKKLAHYFLKDIE